MDKKLIIYCDGGSRGNPGHAASAFVVTCEGKVISQGSKYFEKETNNVAEYNSVLLAMKWLSKSLVINHWSLVTVNLDSQLVERQLNGFYRIRNNGLKKIADKIQKIVLKNKPPVVFAWNFRDKNKLADKLVNKTLDEYLQREN